MSEETIESIESMQLIEGVLDNVRPPLLDFKIVRDHKNYKEYKIITKKNSKDKKGDNPFIDDFRWMVFSYPFTQCDIAFKYDESILPSTIIL